LIQLRITAGHGERGPFDIEDCQYFLPRKLRL
jgi:hypothetical protein